MIGHDASYSTSLFNLNSRFGLSGISHKIYLDINDMTPFKGKEPKLLKAIITGDNVESEKNIKESISIVPITSNSIWEIVNSTGGINRRIVSLPSEYLPHNKNLHIFNLTPIGTAEGQILPHLPGFIN